MQPTAMLRATIYVATLSISMAVLPDASVSAATTFSTLYGFCQQANCSDGMAPHSQLASDAAGNLYGTTAFGGNANQGVVFELAKKGSAYTYRMLYSLCSKSDCSDGAKSTGQLILDVSGNLYGTTFNGGAKNYGTIFKLAPNKSRSKWKQTVLYSFCKKQPCPDGANPQGGLSYQGYQSGLPYDGASPLFGATSGGGEKGDNFGDGVVYSLTPIGKKKWHEKVILCSDCGGASPAGPVLLDSNGNLYTTTARGGGRSSGALIELSPNGTKYSLITVYTFCQLGNCADGSSPRQLSVGPDGTLYGGTAQGGANNEGVLYAVKPNGANSAEQVLYSFCSLANCADGRGVGGPFVVTSDGSVFGTAFFGGAQNKGTVYKVQSGALTVLHNFCSEQNCADSGDPDGGLIIDGSGNLFGTASGATVTGNNGLVFELQP
jgi:uncharacterized repeat protein (TIGR03803 family)